MSVQLDVQLAEDLSESIEEPPSSSLLNSWAQAAWQGEDSDEPVLSLRIVSAAESQQLNSAYRGKDKPTNVLSFPMQLELDDISMSEVLLGDLAICAEVVEHEAVLQKKKPESHWAHMVVHGMLHLQGYDHVEENDAQKMESLETTIMQQLGFADPYRMNNKPNESSKTEMKS